MCYEFVSALIHGTICNLLCCSLIDNTVQQSVYDLKDATHNGFTVTALRREGIKNLYVRVIIS
jgi:hypothetical protein